MLNCAPAQPQSNFLKLFLLPLFFNLISIQDLRAESCTAELIGIPGTVSEADVVSIHPSDDMLSSLRIEVKGIRSFSSDAIKIKVDGVSIPRERLKKFTYLRTPSGRMLIITDIVLPMGISTTETKRVEFEMRCADTSLKRVRSAYKVEPERSFSKNTPQPSARIRVTPEKYASNRNELLNLLSSRETEGAGGGTELSQSECGIQYKIVVPFVYSQTAEENSYELNRTHAMQKGMLFQSIFDASFGIVLNPAVIAHGYAPIIPHSLGIELQPLEFHHLPDGITAQPIYNGSGHLYRVGLQINNIQVSSFTPSVTPPNAIPIGIYDRISTSDYPGSGTLCGAAAMTRGAMVLVDPLSLYTGDSECLSDPNSVFVTAAHEFGHLAGLSHFRVYNSTQPYAEHNVMSYGIDRYELTRDQARAVLTRSCDTQFDFESQYGPGHRFINLDIIPNLGETYCMNGLVGEYEQCESNFSQFAECVSLFQVPIPEVLESDLRCVKVAMTTTLSDACRCLPRLIQSESPVPGPATPPTGPGDSEPPGGGGGDPDDGPGTGVSGCEWVTNNETGEGSSPGACGGNCVDPDKPVCRQVGYQNCGCTALSCEPDSHGTCVVGDGCPQGQHCDLTGCGCVPNGGDEGGVDPGPGGGTDPGSGGVGLPPPTAPGQPGPAPAQGACAQNGCAMVPGEQGYCIPMCGGTCPQGESCGLLDGGCGCATSGPVTHG